MWRESVCVSHADPQLSAHVIRQGYSTGILLLSLPSPRLPLSSHPHPHHQPQAQPQRHPLTLSTQPSSVPSSSHTSTAPRPPLTPRHPFLQPRPIPNPHADFKRLRFRRQARLMSIALQRIEYGCIFRVLGRDDPQGGEDADEGRVELAVGEMGARAHAGAGAVGVLEGGGG
jgi:hypothetical protein